MQDEEEDLEAGFKMGGSDEDEPPEDIPADLDFGLDEEDPDHDS